MPSGQLMQGIILHFDNRVHSCTETWVLVFTRPVRSLSSLLGSSKLQVEGRVTWHSSPQPFLLPGQGGSLQPMGEKVFALPI